MATSTLNPLSWVAPATPGTYTVSLQAVASDGVTKSNVVTHDIVVSAAMYFSDGFGVDTQALPVGTGDITVDDGFGVSSFDALNPGVGTTEFDDGFGVPLFSI
ncbi:hypothetical protein [Thiothrix winogradskyi]|uniref:Uncharacterized protein n=1 Tax=Thiothrix winogradskyi TaxID=96472 RepID=A0ABY3T6T3_9GAMM|nr:hypothetical protein [Thiothrix winogradskyi]UJS26265.1 hypothetical protein L2Y54_09560 [Thiothrix winogradskyi]